MGAFLVTLFMVILVLTAGLMTIIILMQKPSANAGMGAALGGGAAESIFGGETANVLLKYTIWVAVAFFVLSFGLYLGVVSRNHPVASTVILPDKLLDKTPAATTGNLTTTPAPTGESAPASTDKASATTASATTAPAVTAPASDASTSAPAAIPASTAAPADTSAPASTSAPADTTTPALTK
jgi:preprotein translocase subunit SecG